MNPMTDSWYCEIAGREIGPLASEQLRTMAERGQLLPSDCVRRGERGQWRLARQIEGLFPEDTSSPRAISKDREVVEDDGAVATPIIHIEDVGAPRVALPSARRRRQAQQFLIVASLAALAAVLLFAFVFVLTRPADDDVVAGRRAAPRRAEMQREPRLEKRESNPRTAWDEGPEKSDEEVEKNDVNPPKPRPADDTDVTRLEKKPKKSPTAKAKAGDKDEMLAAIGDTVVRIASVVKTPPPSDWAAGDENANAIGGRLLITVEVKNASSWQKVNFVGWTRASIARGAKLTDNLGGVYRVRPLGRAAVPGEGPPMSIAPGRSGRETLAFELPVGKADFLTIELSATGIGEPGVVRLTIPMSKVIEQREEL